MINKKNNLIGKGVLFLVIVGVLVGGVVGLYYDPKTNAPWQKFPQDPSWQDVTPKIAAKNWDNFMDAVNRGIVDNQLMRETLEFKYPGTKITQNSDFEKRGFTDDGKLKDPLNSKISHDLNNFEEGSELEISPDKFTVKNGPGTFEVENGIGEFIDPDKNPIVGCLAKGTRIIDECISKPEGGFEGLKWLLGSSIKSESSLASITGHAVSDASNPNALPNALGGLGTGALEQNFMQGAGLIQQLLSLFQTIFSPIKEAIRTSGQGDTKVVKNDLGGTTTLITGGEVTYEKNNEVQFAVAQNDPNKPGVVKTTSKEGEREEENTKEINPKQTISEFYAWTDITDKGIRDNSNFPVKTESEFRETLDGQEVVFSESEKESTKEPNSDAELASLITAKIIDSVSAQGDLEGQYVKLIEHDLEFNGRDITIYALKTFDNVKAGGQELSFYSGEIEIKFQNQKTFYPRLIKNAPYGVKSVQNKLDHDNEFNLQHYTNRKSKFSDEEQRISVTDVTTKHPKENLIISKIREEMWDIQNKN